MRIGIIGPTNIEATSRAAGLDPAVCEHTARAAGEGLAQRGYAVVLVPDRGVGLLAAEAYHAAGGPRLVGIIPDGGTAGQAATSRCDEHRDLCHDVVAGLPWTEQHERICQLSDMLLCIGMSCGTIAELAWTKWVGDTPVVVIRSLLSGIPPEVEAETDLRWAKDLEDAFRHLGEIATQKRNAVTS